MNKNTPPDSRCVVLVDLHLNGHHLTYLRQYTKVLLAMGRKVAVLYGVPPGMDDKSVLGLDGLNYPDVHVELFATRQFSKSWPQPFRSWMTRCAFRRSFKSALKRSQKALKQHKCLLFFDSMYWTDTKLLAYIVKTAGLPWSGLFLHPPVIPSEYKSSARLEQLLVDSKLKSYAMIHEIAYAKALESSRSPVLFPDITDESLDPNHPVMGKLKQFANGRPLVLAIGYLKSSKGIVALARVALRSEAERFAFAFVGKIIWESYTEEEKVIVRAAMTHSSNCFFEPKYIENEIYYNGCVYASDILYASYENFTQSSNTLTKAALFRKPVIVSEGYLMAARTKAYQLGEVVTQGDLNAIMEAIIRIADTSPSWQEVAKPRWNEYYARHSPEALKNAFFQLLAKYDI